MLEPIDNIKYDFISLPDCSEWGILMKKTDPLTAKKCITQNDVKNLPLIMHQRFTCTGPGPGSMFSPIRAEAANTACSCMEETCSIQ